jgi:hypothetical protein
LQQQFRICEITGVVFEALSMAPNQSFLEISRPPNPLFHIVGFEEVSSLSNKFISSHLDVLIEEITSKHLLSILSIENLRMYEGVSENCLSDKLETLISEEHVKVVQEQETNNG